MNENTAASDTAMTIPLGNMRWCDVLPLLIAALQDGTLTGQRMARDHLGQMAAAADLSGLAMGALMRAAQRGVSLDADMLEVLEQARRRTGAAVALTDPIAASTAVVESCGSTPTQATPDVAIGHLAKTHCGKELPLEVCYSAGGFYLGTYDEDGPCSRESVEYWTSRDAANKAMHSGNWNQREEP